LGSRRAIETVKTALPTPAPASPSPCITKTFNFERLPAPSEPRATGKYGPNHFLSDTLSLRKSASAPHIFSGGDVKMWMANDKALSSLSDADLCTLRSLRQPDWRIEEVLQAVAALRGQPPVRATGNPAARWGQCKEALRSPTLRTELLLFDASQVPLETAHHVLVLLDGLDAEDIRRASPGAAALYEWALGAARWRLQGQAAPDQHSPPSWPAIGKAKGHALTLSTAAGAADVTVKRPQLLGRHAAASVKSRVSVDLGFQRTR